MAKKYIDREAAKVAVVKAIAKGYSAFNAIVSIPTADVVEVVRCRDCKYSEEAWENDKGFLICVASGMDITDNDYCSFGAKMEEDGE